MSTTFDRADGALLVAALAGSVAFFGTVADTWPLVDPDVAAPRLDVTARAAEVLGARGLPVDGFAHAARLDPAEDALRYVSATRGLEATRQLQRDGHGVAAWDVSFKRAGDPDERTVSLQPDGRVLGWHRDLQEDAPGASLTVEAARTKAATALREGLGIDVSTWRTRTVSTREREARVDHTFTWEQTVDAELKLTERATATVAGDVVVAGRRALVVPEAEKRAATSARAGTAALEGLGIALVSVAAVGAVGVFVRRLRDGSADLGRPARWVAALFALHVVSQALDTAAVFRAWNPLWPYWVSALRHVLDTVRNDAWVWLVLYALIAAAESVDRTSSTPRAGALWRLGQGRLGDADVWRGLARGVLLGLVCGGAMAATLAVLRVTVDARIAPQPTGPFLQVLDTAAPALAIPLFFAKVALIEELGYRVFGGTWLVERTGRRWIAVAVPAVIYGLSHTGLTFLPPEDPAWGRALAITVLGLVWGAAYFRWGALPVVVAHLFADTFVFSWPLLATGRADVAGPALVPLLLPLLLAALGAAAERSGRSP